MDDLTILRYYTPEVTLGQMAMPDGETFATIERPWLNNMPRASCIPVGRYLCKPRFYNRGGYAAVHVTDVPGRTYIMFHIGNWIRNSKGCILPNCTYGYEESGIRGYNSGKAFKRFMFFYGKKEFFLNIENFEGGIIH